ncbi:MAG: hypothetical protein KF788_18585 [Piscinibacter sp.]|nr:hypothetical protein [Piscinibacter sp.]
MSAPPVDADGGPALRIMPAGLSKNDLLRLEVFIGVRSDRLRGRWSLVSQAPVDVYIHDADDPPTIPGSLTRAPVQLRVTESSPDAADVTLLARPLQFDAFVEALVAAERQLAAPATSAAIPISAATRPVGAAPAARAVAPAPWPSAPEPAAAARPTPAELATGRFRLRRWPGANLLQTSRYGLRMASFMSARFLSLRELSQLSGVEEQECARFVSTLIDSTLLRVEPLDTAAPPRAADAVAGAPAPAAAPADAGAARPGRSLLTSLRSKLGIGHGPR